MFFFFNSNFDKFFCSNTSVKNKVYNEDWIIDSGANQHMICSDKWLIDEVDVSNLNLTVGHPNGTKTLVKKIGNFQLNNSVRLFGVLFVPEYCVNLLSVHQLARDSKLFVGFDDANCYIQDLRLNKVLGIGNEHDGRPAYV